MENTQLLAKTSAQPAPLDALNATQMVPPVLPAQPITICQEPHAVIAVLASTHLLDQPILLHALLVRTQTVTFVAQPTPPESVLNVKK